jgi:protein-S-isoprenylcysteine O-methyltransferase Ste14
MQQLFDVVDEMERGERSATAMLDWFVAEQLQEEAEARFVCKRLRLAGDNAAALLLLDQQFLEGTALSHVKEGLGGASGGTAGGGLSPGRACRCLQAGCCGLCGPRTAAGAGSDSGASASVTVLIHACHRSAMKTTLGHRLQRWGFSWAGLADNRRGEWWLIAQLALIAAHLLPPEPPLAHLGLSWPLPLRVAGGVLLLIALVLAAQGALNLGESLTPLPEPIEAAPLVMEGAYGRCRHPLYQAVLLCSLGVVLLLGSLLHLGLLLALAVVLSLKARREERRLSALHPDYAAYRRQTPAIVPHLPGLDWREGPPPAP